MSEAHQKPKIEPLKFHTHQFNTLSSSFSTPGVLDVPAIKQNKNNF